MDMFAHCFASDNRIAGTTAMAEKEKGCFEKIVARALDCGLRQAVATAEEHGLIVTAFLHHKRKCLRA
ncbi:MAG: hypothetical protein ACR2FI_03940 [Burkholderiales bacterium]|nr:hypothetical protein [Burkholderiales bacterium]MDQ3196314.1 hypothetical protein [Pseudomonadota bacterium]